MSPTLVKVQSNAAVMILSRRGGRGEIPAATRSLAPFKDTDDVEGLLLRKRIHSDSPCRASANYSHAFDRYTGHDGGWTLNRAPTGWKGGVNAAGKDAMCDPGTTES